jgi:hypothetical protein
MDTLNSLLTSGHKDLADSYNRIVTAASKMPKDHEIPGTNLFIRGFGRDVNGNKLVYVSIMDGRRSSIQTGGSEDMREVNRQYDMSIFSSDDKKAIKNIEEEVLEYVKKYGDPSIKSRLKLYGDRKNTTKAEAKVTAAAKYPTQEDAEFLADFRNFLNSVSTAGSSIASDIINKCYTMLQKDWDKTFGDKSPWSLKRGSNNKFKVAWDDKKAKDIDKNK